MKNTKKVLLIPQPVSYNIRYKNASGDVKTYKISQPIEVTDDALTAYAFSRGVRTFKIEGILDISTVKQ